MFVGMGQNWPLINGYWGWVTAISELIIVVCLLWYMFEILLDTSFVKISDLYMLLLPVWVSNLIKSPTSLHLKQNKQSNAAVLTGCIQMTSISLSKKLEFTLREKKQLQYRLWNKHHNT